jgi:hypothetical protein
MSAFIRVLLIAVILGLTGCSKSAETHEAGIVPRKEMQETGSLQLVGFVSKILGDKGQSGSLIYAGNCATGEASDPFKLATPAAGVSALEALREGFAGDPRLTVKLESGLIRVTGGDVPRDLLDLRIDHITFREEDDPRDAIRKLLALPEVSAYMQEHHLQPLVVLESIYAPPTKGAPRLNGTVKNETIFQTLDRIVRTFPGMWIYRECAGSQGERLVYIGFQQFSTRAVSPG